MSNGTMAIVPKFDVIVTAKAGYGDRQREAMGWQSARTLRIKNVPAWTSQEAITKVERKMGTDWKVIEVVGEPEAIENENSS